MEKNSTLIALCSITYFSTYTCSMCVYGQSSNIPLALDEELLPSLWRTTDDGWWHGANGFQTLRMRNCNFIVTCGIRELLMKLKNENSLLLIFRIEMHSAKNCKTTLGGGNCWKTILTLIESLIGSHVTTGNLFLCETYAVEFCGLRNYIQDSSISVFFLSIRILQTCFPASIPQHSSNISTHLSLVKALWSNDWRLTNN